MSAFGAPRASARFFVHVGIHWVAQFEIAREREHRENPVVALPKAQRDICALCLKEETLRRSHIIPQFMYSEMRDSKNRILILNSNPDVRDRFSQSGMWEYLLCDACEGVIGRYEDYACRVIYGGDKDAKAMFDGPDLKLERLDYAKLKLFLLSLIWRMGVSQEEFFREVELGPYEQRLRAMIVNGNPGLSHEFGVFCIAPILNKSRMVCTAPPEAIRHDSVRIYRCLIGGLLFCFVVSNQRLPTAVEARFPNPAGQWSILQQNVEEITYLKDYVMRMGAAINARDSKR